MIGPGSTSNVSRRRAVDPRADDVGRHQVRGELDAGEDPPTHGGQRPGGQGLGHTGHAFDQAVAAGQQGDEQSLDQLVLTDDHPFHLQQRPLQPQRLGRHVLGIVGGPVL